MFFFQNEVYEVLQSDPDYSTNNSSRTFDDERYLAFKQALALKTLKIFSLERQLSDLKRNNTITRIMVSLNPASFIKSTVGDKLFTSSIMNMGTSRHSKYIDDSNNGKIFGCYCLTEIGHGSNARGMRTTATYDKQKKVFILNSPDFEAAKCWAGGLGQIASYGTVYAQLILDGKNLGLHAFVVPIRNPNTLLPYPGLVVGDMGEKLGLNGIDNGFLKFDNYEIPRENILNRIADVSEDGRYVTSIKDPNKRYGAALGSLSAGRVNIACICETLGLKALTIALRYAAVRKQFGPEGENEIPILEYQSHCLRLIPYLAAAYVLRNFNDYLSEQFFEFMIETMTGNVRPDAPEMGIEIHGVSSSSKPMAGWLMRDAIQESRETCAGHGYLKASGIGDIRNDHDANLTYEGENHVLVQQTSNWLLKLWPLVLQQKSISSPMKSTDFLTNGLNILKNSKFSARNIDETCQPDTIISTYQWLVCYLLKSTANKLDDEIKSGKDLFTAKNDTQVFYAKNLSIAFIQHFFLQRMLVTISKAEDPAIKNVLTKLFSLFGLWALEKYHLPTLYKGEFVVGPMASSLIQDSILKLCLDLKNDAVALIDAIAVPDFILNSILGSSDGMVYKRLQDSMYRNQYCMNRPPWWREVVNWKNNITNKL
nr:peroxisomal acyl-coenzyme A oxidase 3-like [Leptinotarsa decemlineata]